MGVLLDNSSSIFSSYFHEREAILKLAGFVSADQLRDGLRGDIGWIFDLSGLGGGTWYTDFMICTWSRVRDDVWVHLSWLDLFWRAARICYRGCSWTPLKFVLCIFASSVMSYVDWLFFITGRKYTHLWGVNKIIWWIIKDKMITVSTVRGFSSLFRKMFGGRKSESYLFSRCRFLE